MSPLKEKFNLVKREIIRGSLQERLGYDVYDKILNHDWENLPEKSREKFFKFLEREGEIIAFSGVDKDAMPTIIVSKV